MPQTQRQARREARAREEARARYLPSWLRSSTVLLAAFAVVALGLLGFAGYRWATQLGPNELPTRISNGQRQGIQEAFTRFFAGVNEYSPQAAMDTVLTPAEVGTEEVARLVVSIGPLQSQNVKYEVRSLNSADVVSERAVVHAVVETNFGVREADLVRRDGVWRLASIPSVLLPPSGGPLRLESEVVNSYRWQGGERLSVVGRVRNAGDQTAHILATPGFISDEAGRTIRTEASALVTKPFLHAGEEAIFRLDFTVEAAQAIDAGRFTLIVNARPAIPADERVLTERLAVEPPIQALRPGTPPAVTVHNGDARVARATVVGYVKDETGRLLTVAGRLADLQPGARLEVTFDGIDANLPNARAVEFSAWGAAGR